MSERILVVVEDNTDDVFFMRRAVKEAGLDCRLEIAQDGRQAIDWLQGLLPTGEPPPVVASVLVLLDLKLPELSGLQVLEWIKGHPQLSVLPVIVLSSSTEPVDVEQAYRLGANAYVSKPADHRTLIAFIESVKSFWIQFNQFPQLPMGGLSAHS